jgi:hypothetical protein
VVSGEDLLVLPPVPREILEELTTLFHDEHTGSTTEPETTDDELEKRREENKTK